MGIIFCTHKNILPIPCHDDEMLSALLSLCEGTDNESISYIMNNDLFGAIILTYVHLLLIWALGTNVSEIQIGTTVSEIQMKI